MFVIVEVNLDFYVYEFLQRQLTKFSINIHTFQHNTIDQIKVNKFYSTRGK